MEQLGSRKHQGARIETAALLQHYILAYNLLKLATLLLNIRFNSVWQFISSNCCYNRSSKIMKTKSLKLKKKRFKNIKMSITYSVRSFIDISRCEHHLELGE